MNIESSKFFKINKIAKTFIILVLACCILMNIVDMIKYYEFISIQFHLFIVVILSIFIASLYFENYFTTVVLLIFNILFWYYTITERKDLSWYDNPFNHYDVVLHGFENFFSPLTKLFDLVIFSPLCLFNNLLIWTIIIPFRIKKFYLKKIK
ncbi:hypothetical protein [Chryseobacterium balustinum]|uniref:Uncharacterized protein n=1 Tax=Chryseobacterium balustinum TaxID=246 RepID=A0AAX2IFW5_9FLAO|nr:hypothetical protein [Chryseobacterium balustinum]AZB31672.1 hypothetical protein EB354_21780 [Chryseobacterium balustinum]SKB84832.1 hypothetical protein SAMN05421800_110124 [Chryseobacterium balustinum]SQA86967.1 Uncharacterised protein [Chryseobacterium balustinum]